MKTVFDNKDFFNVVKDSLNENNNVSFIVKGNSMKPFFTDGETEVFIKKKFKYGKYDVCLFEYNNKVLLHRIVKISDKITFCGDNSYSKEIVSSLDIIGYVYLFKNNKKTVDTKNTIYKMKVRLYLLFKMVKKIIKENAGV